VTAGAQRPLFSIATTENMAAEMSEATRYASIVMGAIFLLTGTVKLININNDVYTYMVSF
jgi:hypothetical protein